MLPIASEIATRLTREHAQSALPGARIAPEPNPHPRASSHRRHQLTAATLRRLARRAAALADRIDHPVTAEQQ